MGRRKDDGILDVLVVLPWWISVSMSAVCYIFLAYIAPALLAGDSVASNAFATALPQIAYIPALILLIPAPFSFLRRLRKRRLLDAQKDSESIRSLNWREFEELLAEAYRRKGYNVIENSQLGPDGGIDVRLYKDGRRYLVQCKHWKSQKVGVSVVREMLGLITAENAHRGLVVTSGTFTEEALRFAQSQPIDLIGGGELYELISSVQTSPRGRRLESNDSSEHKARNKAQKTCPSCGSELVSRIARKGVHAGSSFYGCASFPKCRYTKAGQG